jgi:hypothetical protein
MKIPCGKVIDLGSSYEAGQLLGVLALVLCGRAKHDADRINSFCDEFGFDAGEVYREFLRRGTFAGISDWTQ